MIKREDDGIWMQLEERIRVHHEEAYICLTTPAGLSRWLAVGVKMELETGGLITLSWDREFAKTTTVSILDYDAGGRITWDWQVRMGDRHAPVYWHVEPSVEHGCIVHFRQGPFDAGTESLMAMADEAASWRWYLCNLRCVLEASFDMRAVRPL